MKFSYFFPKHSLKDYCKCMHTKSLNDEISSQLPKLNDANKKKETFPHGALVRMKLVSPFTCA